MREKEKKKLVICFIDVLSFTLFVTRAPHRALKKSSRTHKCRYSTQDDVPFHLHSCYLFKPHPPAMRRQIVLIYRRCKKKQTDPNCSALASHFTWSVTSSSVYPLKQKSSLRSWHPESHQIMCRVIHIFHFPSFFSSSGGIVLCVQLPALLREKEATTSLRWRPMDL